MTQKEILDFEERNVGVIRLYLEGTFYKAYERSAFAFCTRVKDFKILRKESKTLGRDILYVGFPMSALDKTLSQCMTRPVDDRTMDVILSYPIDGSAEKLKSAVPLIADFLWSHLRLRLNYHKVKLMPVEEGVPFLGSVASPNGRRPGRRSIRKIRRRNVENLCREKDPYAALAIRNSYLGYLGHFSSGAELSRELLLPH